MSASAPQRTRAQESRAAIERLYITMRHLFIRGSYKPLGVSGSAIIKDLLILNPEIYGLMADEDRVELEGLLYVIERLPRGIEECRIISLISREGLEESGFEAIVPPKRRRNCYRVDDEQMYIELTRGRSDIYDILTHLTFLYIESEKIKKHALDRHGNTTLSWQKLEQMVLAPDASGVVANEQSYVYLSTLLGRTYRETVSACRSFEATAQHFDLFRIAYWLGRLAIEEQLKDRDREIFFSADLRDRVGHHVYGELWANTIKRFLYEQSFLERPVHIISANLHSVLNTLFASRALKTRFQGKTVEEIAETLSDPHQGALRQKVLEYARKNGLWEIQDTSGTNIALQIIDTARLDPSRLPVELQPNGDVMRREKPVIVVMDYAFGEQAFETMDELLRPFDIGGSSYTLRVESISVMGKAGILKGDKGDIMVPTAHLFEGTADNYPLDNEFGKSDFEGHGLQVFEGPMVTVLGTSLQNKDILEYFLNSSWKAIGLEMEGAHYQKAIQAAAKIRGNIGAKVRLRYAYYASDNPLITGKTLASGSLGLEGVKPTYLITLRILQRILHPMPAA
jgi:hypothetical protein